MRLTLIKCLVKISFPSIFESKLTKKMLIIVQNTKKKNIGKTVMTNDNCISMYLFHLKI